MTTIDDPCAYCIRAIQLRTDRANLFVRVDALKEEKERAEQELAEWRAYAKRLQAAGGNVYSYSLRSQKGKHARAEWRRLMTTAPDFAERENNRE